MKILIFHLFAFLSIGCVQTQFAEFIKLLDDLDPSVKFDDNLSGSNEYLDQKIKTFLDTNKPKNMKMIDTFLKSVLNSTGNGLNKVASEIKSMALILKTQQYKPDGKFIKFTPQSLLVETAYEANEFMKTMPNAIILMSDLMSAVMVAEYGINVDKKDNSEVGVSRKVLSRIDTDAVEIGQANVELKNYVHRLNSDVKKIQKGIRPFQLSFFGDNPDAKFDAIEKNLDYLSDNLQTTQRYIDQMVELSENVNLNKIAVKNQPEFMQTIRNFVTPLLKTVIGYDTLASNATSMQKNVMALNRQLTDV